MTDPEFRHAILQECSRLEPHDRVLLSRLARMTPDELANESKLALALMAEGLHLHLTILAMREAAK